MFSFNLLDEPWIPVRPGDGGPVREVGLRELLTQARAFQRIDDPSPLVTVALLRLSLALLHRALRGPKNAEQAAEWFRDGFPEDRLEAYFTAHAQNFDLFHPERPFWQVRDLTPDLEGGKYRSHWTRLGSEVGSANTSPLFNPAARPGGERSDPLSPAEAARRLVEGQTFLLGGLIKRFTTSAKAAPVATYALTAAQGHTLHETLCLNLTPYPEYGTDQAVWEREPLTVAAVKRYYELELGDVPLGRADRYTWPARSVRLIPEGDEAGSVRVATIGFAAGLPLEGAPEGAGRNLDPMVTLRAPADPKKPERFPLKLRREQLLWRDLSALLPDPHHEIQVAGQGGDTHFQASSGGQAPGTLTHARLVLEGVRGRQDVALTVTGQLSDQGKTFAYRQETYTLPAAFVTDAEGFTAAVTDALGAARGMAEGLRQATARLAAEVLSRGGERDPHKEDVATLARTLPGLGAYWAGLEAPFRVFLSELGTPEQARAAWVSAVDRQARRAWELNLQGAGGDGQTLGFAYRPRRTDGKYQPSPQALLERALRALHRSTDVQEVAPA
ncbi:type I-E CRISPR-associated protein Cse1/CasA [Deinococcus metallilatus]|uniref:CRISPR system Cascade subunit CasA n=1 Tax=Deinococcus metallilatus TaxID=1211322 RepID=A0ABR6MSQ3_9DEIO|nr:type I-E CRISPR-associated protein Cse1/CasA [Deinococcus metallilatus]MBB5294934.1 CRISPR system Cascade subunit CasA [Deinococcus metallilatus]GMA16864.1 CRISPR-associated protein CasA/Cse1 [Deinococcus metallilatus]